MRSIRRLCLAGRVPGDTRGVTSLEYAILGLFLVVAIISAVQTIPPKISAAFASVGSSLVPQRNHD